MYATRVSLSGGWLWQTRQVSQQDCQWLGKGWHAKLGAWVTCAVPARA